MKWTDIVVALTALYAALLATYTAIVGWLDGRRRVDIKTGIALLGFPHGVETALSIQGASRSKRPITLTAVGFRIKGEPNNVIWPRPRGDKPLPCTLTDGESITNWAPVREVARILASNNLRGRVQIKGFYNDAIGPVHIASRWYTFDVDSWLEER